MCNVTGEYFRRGSTSEYKTVIGYRTFGGELCVVNGEFSNLWVRLIGKSGFRFSKSKSGFPNQMQNPKTDFTSEKSVFRVDFN